MMFLSDASNVAATHAGYPKVEDIEIYECDNCENVFDNVHFNGRGHPLFPEYCINCIIEADPEYKKIFSNLQV